MVRAALSLRWATSGVYVDLPRCLLGGKSKLDVDGVELLFKKS